MATVSNIACFAAVYMVAGLIDSAGHRIALPYSDMMHVSFEYWVPILVPRHFFPAPEAQLFEAVQNVSGYGYVGLVGTIAVVSS